MRNSALQTASLSATDALREAVAALQQAGIETASLDARVLLETAMGASREELLAAMDAPLGVSQNAAYRELIRKRALHVPVSQLIGKREFWGIECKVTADTLDPRPDSETLVEAALEHIGDRGKPVRILDLGTGTGCLLIALLKECANAKGIGVELSEKTLAVARENAAQNGVAARAGFIHGGWDSAQGRFDIILSNPPYIPTADIATLAPEVAEHEPKLALDGGADGLDAYRVILPRLPELLAENGRAFFEIGMGQEKEISKLVGSCGLVVGGIKQDLNGIPRCIIIRHGHQLSTINHQPLTITE